VTRNLQPPPATLRLPVFGLSVEPCLLRAPRWKRIPSNPLRFWPGPELRTDRPAQKREPLDYPGLTSPPTSLIMHREGKSMLNNSPSTKPPLPY